jgi:hypothetical protein
MKKTIFAGMTAVAVILFTACSKNVDQPAGNAKASSSTVSTATKRPFGCATCNIPDSTKTTTHP